MTTWQSVGISRYRGDVLGIEQFMEQAAARQVLALIAFIATLPGCRRLTINEGRRTRARQKTLRQRYEAYLRGGPWAPLAAVLFTSRHDEVNHGNAADLGGPDGEALNAAEIAAIKKYGPNFGVTFTGLTFSPPEPWHVEGDGRTFIPQYALASGGATPFPDLTEDDMPLTDADIGKILNFPAYQNNGKPGPTVSEILKALDLNTVNGAKDSKFIRDLLSEPGEVNGGRSLADKIEDIVKGVDKVAGIVGRKVRRDTKATVTPARDDLVLDQVDDDTQANTGVRILLKHFGYLK